MSNVLGIVSAHHLCIHAPKHPNKF